MIKIYPRVYYNGMSAINLSAEEGLGQTATITENDIINELRGRGYSRQLAIVTPSPVVVQPPVVTRVSRTEAIGYAVTEGLKIYGYANRCTSVGGCFIEPAKFDYIVGYAGVAANRYYNQGFLPGQSPIATIPYLTATPIPYSPSYTLPLLTNLPFRTAATVTASQYFTGEFGATAPGAPVPMSKDEKIAFGLNILASLAQTTAGYFQAKAERERLMAMGAQIPSLTAAEVAEILKQYTILNPNADKSTAAQVAAGVFGQEKPTSPAWMWPVIAGLGVGVLLLVSKRKIM